MKWLMMRVHKDFGTWKSTLAFIGGMILGVGIVWAVLTLSGCLPKETFTAVDNSKSLYFPGLKQQRFDDCSVFTMVYHQLSYEYSRQGCKKGHIPRSRRTFSPRLAWEEQNLGTGVDLYRTLMFMILKGSPEESVYPYREDTEPTSEVWANAAKHKVKSVEYIRTIEGAKKALDAGYILSFGTYFGSWEYKNIKDNPDSALDDTEVGKSAVYWSYLSAGQHSLTLVGYNDAIWVDCNSNRIIDEGELGAFKAVDDKVHWIAYDSTYKKSLVDGAPVDDVYRTSTVVTAFYKIILEDL